MNQGAFQRILHGGIRRKFEQGKVSINHTKFLGYDKDEDGNLIINEKQAKIIRRIYREFQVEKPKSGR